ncbi:NnrS family protein, partial [PVC group bacterium]|nr:NnrS family protein [PVC group bacterium]
FYYLSKALIFQAFPVFLLLGVGGFLIRSILGWADNAEKKSKNYSRAFAVNTMIGAIILFAFFVESFYRPFSAGLIKALFVTIGFLYNMKIYRKPASDKITSRWLMFSMWLVIAGMWGQTLWPSHELAFLHLCFIGGFALAIICVATRVILNHGGYKRLLTGPSAMFSTAACLMTVGLFTRFIADFLPKTYSQHLTYAGTIWVLGLVVWSFFVMPKIIKKSREISS